MVRANLVRLLFILVFGFSVQLLLGFGAASSLAGTFLLAICFLRVSPSSFFEHLEKQPTKEISE